MLEYNEIIFDFGTGHILTASILVVLIETFTSEITCPKYSTLRPLTSKFSFLALSYCAAISVIPYAYLPIFIFCLTVCIGKDPQFPLVQPVAGILTELYIFLKDIFVKN